jgi:hypothetical protein
LGWIRRFIVFNGRRHPQELGETEIQAFLGHLAVERRVSASTQNQAACALLFLYKDILKVEDVSVSLMRRAQRPERLPVVLTKQEVRAVLDRMTGPSSECAGRVALPSAIDRKYPNANREWGWQWVFLRRAGTWTGKQEWNVAIISMSR